MSFVNAKVRLFFLIIYYKSVFKYHKTLYIFCNVCETKNVPSVLRKNGRNSSFTPFFVRLLPYLVF